MKISIQIKGKEYDRDWLHSNSENFQSLMKSSYLKKVRPICLCKSPGIELYIALHDGLYVCCRMPGTGHLHHFQCPFHEVDKQLSGKLHYSPQAFLVDEDIYRITYPFFNSHTYDSSASRESDRPYYFSLNGLFDLLFELTSFNRWSPSMYGKRNWQVFRYYFLNKASNVLFGKFNTILFNLLYIPYQFDRNNPNSNIVNFRKFINQPSSIHSRFVIGELKTIELNNTNSINNKKTYRLTIKHLNGVQFIIPEIFAKKLGLHFLKEEIFKNIEHKTYVMFSLEAHENNLFIVRGIAFQYLTSDFIPIYNLFDYKLIQNYVIDKKKFMKPLRYDMPDHANLYSAVVYEDSGNVIKIKNVDPIFEMDSITELPPTEVGGMA